MKKPAAARQTMTNAARQTMKKPAAASETPQKQRVDWSRVTEDQEDQCYADFVEMREWNQSFKVPVEKFRAFRREWFLYRQNGSPPETPADDVD